MSGFLALEDGTVFRGESVGAEGVAFGEAVFTTAMTGYQEVVTDPSYAEQLVAFTAPMVGNYGVAPERSESRRPHARAVVMREARGPAWTDWLHERGIVALAGIDTRSLVLHLREAGAMRAIAVAGEASVEEALAAVREQPRWRAARSSPASRRTSPTSTRRRHGPDRRRRLRLQALDPRPARRGRRGRDRLPARRRRGGARELDGVLLSNGPGDPSRSPRRSRPSALLGRVPILGICLGHQLLALATGHETFKLPFGHRGANHPVLEKRSNRVLVTSQNHGFAVARRTRRR